MSLAVGPIGRNGGADVALNTKGKVAAMYSYSKTKGLFGGISVEGSIIVERQDANAIAYEADVTSKQLLSGVVPTPVWAEGLVRALERCTGLPTGQKWIQEDRTGSDVSGGYHFSGVGSSSSQSSPRGGIIDRTMDRTKRISGTFSPSWGKKKNASSYFPDPQDDLEEAPSAARSPFADSAPRKSGSLFAASRGTDRLDGFDTHFESDFKPNARKSSEFQRKSTDIEDYETRMRQNASPYSAFGGPSPTQTQFADISAQQRLALSRNGSTKSSSLFNNRGKDKDRDTGSFESGRPSSTFGGLGGWTSRFTRKDSDRKTNQFDLMTGDDDDHGDPFSAFPEPPKNNGMGMRPSFDSGNGNGLWGSNGATNGNNTRNGGGFYPGLVETNVNLGHKDANVWEEDPFGAKPARLPTPKISTKPALREPQTEGVARAIALFDFVAQEVCLCEATCALMTNFMCSLATCHLARGMLLL